MEIEAYLERIGYAGSREPSADTLRAVHRAHLYAIPYENLDIHLGRTLGLDVPGIYRKLVAERRGGWCYEMNGLLAWALRELGFRVELLAGAVPRASAGPTAAGNHLVLLVHMPDGPYLADVGFGDGFLEPLPLREGTTVQEGWRFRVERDPESDRWVVQNHQFGGAPSFDFDLVPHQMADFLPRCTWLQSAPDSGFVRVTVCQRFVPEGIISLRGAVMKTVTPDGVAEHVIDTAANYAAALRDCFGLDVDAERLWALVWPRHQAWMAQLAAEGAAPPA